MDTWTGGIHSADSEHRSIERYAPKDLTNQQDFARQLREIDSDQTLTSVDKYRYRKQLMRAVFMAKQKEINHHLDSYENFLLAKKDVESKTIALEAQKAIMRLEEEQLSLMKDIGLSHTQEIADTLSRASAMLNDKLVEIGESELMPDIKQMTLTNVRRVWERTIARVTESVDTYMDQLYQKERTRLR